MITGLPFFVSYLSPILLILLGNFLILALIICTLFRSTSISKEKQINTGTKVRISLACSVLMGLTWTFGFLAIREAKFIFQILFCVLNSLQGLFIFLFYCLLNKEARREWKRCLTFKTPLQTESRSSHTGNVNSKHPTKKKSKSSCSKKSSTRAKDYAVCMSPETIELETDNTEVQVSRLPYRDGSISMPRFNRNGSIRTSTVSATSEFKGLHRQVLKKQSRDLCVPGQDVSDQAREVRVPGQVGFHFANETFDESIADELEHKV